MQQRKPSALAQRLPPDDVQVCYGVPFKQSPLGADIAVCQLCGQTVDSGVDLRAHAWDHSNCE